MRTPQDIVADRYIRSLNPALYLPLWKKDTGKTWDVALNFDGVDDKVSIPDASVFNMPDVFTLEMWVNTTSFGNNSRLICRNDSMDFLLYQPSNGSLVLYINGGAVASTDMVTALGTYVHIVVTFDRTLSSNNAKIFANGVLVGNGTYTTACTNSASPIMLAGRASDDARDWNGVMDLVRIYNRAISASEVAINYGRGRTNKPQPADKTGLVAWYQMDEASGTTLADASGNGNTGTITGATWVDNSQLSVESEDAHGHLANISHAGLWTPQGYKFNGTANKITIPTTGIGSVLNIAGDITIIMWVKPIALAFQDLIQNGTAAQNGYLVYWNADGSGAFGKQNVGDWLIFPAGSITVGKSNFLYFSRIGSIIRGQIDNKQYTKTHAGTFGTSGSALNIATGGDGFANAIIGEVEILPYGTDFVVPQRLRELTKWRYQ